MYIDNTVSLIMDSIQLSTFLFVWHFSYEMQLLVVPHNKEKNVNNKEKKIYRM